MTLKVTDNNYGRLS